MDREALKKRLTVEEGERLVAYLDSLGILTVGVGHNCVDEPVPGVTKPGDAITKEESQRLLDHDIDQAVADLDGALPWWSQLDDARQNVLLDMCFNMGLKTLLTFKYTLALIEEGNYGGAAAAMSKSLWHRQVGRRATFLENAMSSGVYA